jgi:hypothetical protein
VAAATLTGLPAVEAAVEAPEVLQLTRGELLEKVRGVIREEEQFNDELEAFLQLDENRPGLKDTYEYCINTDGLYVEAAVSRCSPCDEATLELRRLEVERAKGRARAQEKGTREGGKEGRIAPRGRLIPTASLGECSMLPEAPTTLRPRSARRSASHTPC